MLTTGGAGVRAGLAWLHCMSRGQGSRLLATPLTLHRPSQKLLHMPRHVHGVIEVKVAVSVQHGVSPVKGSRDHSRLVKATKSTQRR